MPPPVEPASCLPASRANLALYHLGRARRQLIDAKPYLAGTDAGRNFDGLLSALESRIDRVRLHGLGPIDPPEDEPVRVNADPVAIAYGVDGGESPVFCTVEGYPVVPE